MDVAASGELAGRGDLDGDLSDGDFSCDLGGGAWPVPGMLPAGDVAARAVRAQHNFFCVFDNTLM